VVACAAARGTAALFLLPTVSRSAINNFGADAVTVVSVGADNKCV